MNRKASVYAVIGGCVGAVLTMAVCCVLPIGAQNGVETYGGDAWFGEITCTGLKVVDSDGEVWLKLGYDADGGVIDVQGNNILKATHIDGESFVIRRDGGATLMSGESISILRTGGGGGVAITVDETGGSVSVTSDIVEPTKRATMRIAEYGGRIAVSGKGEGQAVMGVNEYGNGAVSIWDANGDRVARLK